MKKSEINPEEVLKDANKVMEIINKLDNLDLKNINSLEKEIKEIEKNLTSKYQDYIKEDKEDLDTEE